MQILGVPIMTQLFIGLWVFKIGVLLCTIFFTISFLILLLSHREEAEFTHISCEGSLKLWMANYSCNGEHLFNMFPTDHVLTPYYRTGLKKMLVVSLFKKRFVIDGYAVATILLGFPVFALMSVVCFGVIG